MSKGMLNLLLLEVVRLTDSSYEVLYGKYKKKNPMEANI
jgi:hypothetical protein